MIDQSSTQPKSQLSSKLTPGPNRLASYLAYASAAVIAVVPFHAFLTVWAASLGGHYTLIRLWKELILATLVVGCVALLVLGRSQRKQLIEPASQWLQRQPGILLIVAYVVLLLGLGLAALAAQAVTPKAFAYGLLLDGRFLVFFLITWLVSCNSSWIVRHWQQLVLIPAGIVVLFGILQLTLLPADFLSHFGYNSQTIDAVQTVDQKADYQRIQSTLRGANPLGAYLIVVISAIAIVLLRARQQRLRYGVMLLASIVVLAFTFSRSAWIGVLAALGWLIWAAASTLHTRRWLLLVGCVSLLIFGAVGYSLRTNDVFQNTFFHTDETSQSAASSNLARLGAIQTGVADVLRIPLGSGTGTAGPASFYNGSQPPRIAENYYLQIGQEIGIIGVILFVAINVLVGRGLWQRREHLLPQLLLASLIGISLVNLLSHAWTDDTLSYIWWGLAGAALAMPISSPLAERGMLDGRSIIKHKHERNRSTNQKTT